MIALIPLLLTLIPDIASLFTGPKTEANIKAVSGAVQAVVGTTDPEAAAAALAADPAKAADLKVALARIAADAAAADRQEELDEMKAQLADVAGARQQTVDLAKAGSSIAWAAPVVSTVVSVGFFAVIGLLAFAPVSTDPGRAAMLNTLVGVLATGFASVLGYWLGSSAGSARKTELLQASSVASPTAPTSVLGAVAAGVETTADDLNARSLAQAQAG